MRLWIAVLLTALCGSAAAKEVDGVAAVVDGHVITRSEVAERVQIVSRTGGARGPNREASALDVLIEKTLLDREADRFGVEVADSEVTSTIDDIRARNGLSEAQFRSALAAEGVDYATYFEEVRGQVRKLKLAGQVLRSRMEVGDEALREYYLKNVADCQEPPKLRLRHIQLSGEESRQLAEQVRQRMLEGGDVSALLDSALNEPGEPPGVDMGYLNLDNLAAEVKGAVRDLPPGGVSDVLELGGGCHIFVVDDRSEGRIRHFEEVRDQIRERYLQEKEDELYRTWLDSLKEKARIVRYL